MRFDLTDLQLFVHILDSGTLTAAAGLSHMTLASASERVRGMESQLGAALLERGARGLLGGALVVYGLWGLWGRPFHIPAPHQRWVGAVVGLLTGAVTALTGVFVVPGVPYLQALQLDRQALMQGMGLSFTVSTLALGLGLSGFGGSQGSGLGGTALWASCAMLLPVLLGMAAGERLRARLSAVAFKRALMGSLLALGGWMLWQEGQTGWHTTLTWQAVAP